MSRKTIQARIIAISVAIIILLGINNFLVLKPESLENAKLLHLVEQNFTDLEKIEAFGQLYQSTSNRKYLEKLSSVAYNFGRSIDLLEKGGKSSFQGKEVAFNKIDNDGVINVVKRIASSFAYHEEQIKKLMANKAEDAESSIEFLVNNNAALVLDNILLGDTITEYIADRNTFQSQLSTVILVLIIIGIGFAIYIARGEFIRPLSKLSHAASQIASGIMETISSSKQSEELNLLESSLNNISKNLQKASHFAEDIGNGKFDTDFELVGENDTLGKSLVEMRDRLMMVAADEKQRNWTINGVAKFGDLLRSTQNSPLEELAYEFIISLVKYLDANQGGVFLINEDNESDKYLELKAAYAYGKKKYITKRIEFEEGLVGQSLLEKDHIYIEDIPDEYLNITSGLGQANPTSILIVPVSINDQQFGALEIASFKTMNPFEIEFIKSITESLASSLSVIKMNENTQRLLEETRKINIELQEKEEQMNQFAEELQANQEELSRDLGERTNLNNKIIEAINKTSATIEFDLDGNILEVNTMYLSVMGYERDELIGKNEKVLVKQEDMEGYSMLWDSLNEGSFHGGEYCRISKHGKEVWLNGTYNPIPNVDGDFYKVIQFGQFTTDQKEHDLELRGFINTFNKVFPVLEVDRDSNIIKANPDFLGKFGYKRKDLRKRPIVELIQLGDDVENNFRNAWSNVQIGEVAQISLPVLTKEGEVKYCEANMSAIYNLAGIINKVLVILVDETSQEKHKTELGNIQEA